MIRFSRREDYAVILVTTLASAFDRRLVSLTEIANEYRLSILFLRNVANDLRTKGLISAVEGKNGGYALKKNPKVLKMGEVLKAFSTEALLSCCSAFSDELGGSHQSLGATLTEIKDRCPQEGFCRTGYIWRKLNKEFLERVSSLSVQEFMEYR